MQTAIDVDGAAGEQLGRIGRQARTGYTDIVDANQTACRRFTPETCSSGPQPFMSGV